MSFGHEQIAKTEVVKYLEDFLSGRGSVWNWDDFISVPIGDTELENVRLRCATLPESCRPEKPGQYCNEEGLAVLRTLLVRLQG